MQYRIKQSSKKATEIVCMFDSRKYTSKPKGTEIGVIKNRIENNKFSVYKTLNEFIEEIKSGKTCIPAGIRGEAEKNFKKIQVFMVDLDNKIDSKDVGIESNEHITLEKVKEICKKQSLTPTLIYTTFSHSKEQNRFRLVYIFEEAITDYNVAKAIPEILLEKLHDLHPDKSKKNLSDLFFAGKEIVDKSNMYYTIEKDNIQKENNEEKEQDIEEEQQIINVKIEEKEYEYKIPKLYFVTKDKMIFYETIRNGKNVVVRLSHLLVFPTAIIQNIDSGEEKIEIAVCKNNEWKKGIFPKQQVYSSIVELSNFGIPVNSGNAKAFIKYLAELEADNQETIPVIKAVTKLGWREDNQFVPFSNECQYKIDIDYKLEKWVKAYSQKGTLEEWKENIAIHRKNDLFRFILATSFSAPLLEILGQRIFVVFNWGNSRAGKTAALKVALSVWGNPEDLTCTFNTTAVGIERLAGFYNDLPLGLDEKQVNKSQSDLEKIIFMLSSGVSKIRGNKVGGVQPVNTWKTVVLATGEETISNINTTTGIQTRCLEIEGSPFNYEEKVASKMYDLITQNYGTAGKEYINLIINKYSNNKYKVLKEKWKYIKEKLEATSTNDIYSYLSAVSTVVLADLIVSKEIFEEENEEASLKMGREILNNLAKGKEIDIVEKSYEYIESWLLGHHKFFDQYKEPSEFENPRLNPEEDLVDSMVNGKSFGIYQNNIYYVHRFILQDKLEKKGFSYLKTVREFAKRGYIIPTIDKNGNILENTVQKKFRGRNVRMFAFPMKPIEQPLNKEERKKLEEEQVYKCLGHTKESYEQMQESLDI